PRQAHLEQETVADDPGTVDPAIHRREVIHGGLHHALRGYPPGDTVGTRHGLAARCANLLGHHLGCATPRLGSAQVVDHDTCALCREGQGELPANTAPGPGNDDDFFCSHVRHVAS